MSKCHKKSKRPSIQHPCADLAALWGTTILLDLKGYKQLNSGFSTYTCNADLLMTIGLSHLEDKEIGTQDFLDKISQQHKKFQQKNLKPAVNIKVTWLISAN